MTYHMSYEKKNFFLGKRKINGLGVNSEYLLHIQNAFENIIKFYTKENPYNRCAI